MKKGMTVKRICFLISMFLVCAGVFCGNTMEAAAGGSGLSVFVEIRDYWSDGLPLSVGYEGEATVIQDSQIVYTKSAINRYGTYDYPSPFISFDAARYDSATGTYADDPSLLPPVGTTFALTEVDIPKGYELVESCSLPITGVFTQKAYDQVVRNMQTYEDQPLATIYLTVYVQSTGLSLDISEATVISRRSGYYYDGNRKTFEGELRYKGRELQEGVHYTVGYIDNVNAGTMKVVFSGKGIFAGTQQTVEYKIGKQSLTSADISAIPAQTYTGKALTPQITVTCNGRTLKNGEDYLVNYSNNVNVGTATVTVTGTGNYEGSCQKSFTIAAKSSDKPLPEKNELVAVNGAYYKVTKSAKTGGTVAFQKPISKKGKAFTVPATITYNGYKFKVTAVSSSAFKKCKNLQTVTIGKNVRKIGASAFNGCSKLKTVKIKGTSLKSVGKNAFKGIYKKAVIKVPSSKLTSYKKLLKGKGQAATVKIKKS